MKELLKNIDLHIVFMWSLKIIEVIVLYLILRLILRSIIKRIEKKAAKLDVKDVKDNPATSFIISTLNVIVNLIILLALLPIIGIKTTSIIAFIGAIGLGIGIGLQDMAKDLLSGVKLLLTKPFNVGDLISTNSIQGTVKSMNIFHTIILKSDNTEVYIPNGSLSNSEMTNFFKYKVRSIEFEVPIDFNNNVEQIRVTLLNILEKNNRICQDIDYQPKIVLDNITINGISMICTVYMNSKDSARGVRSEILEAFHTQLKKDGIKFPISNLK